jgi:hypothetical protein
MVAIVVHFETTATSAMRLASDVEGLRLVLGTTIADRYEVQVPDDGSEVRLLRRAGSTRPRGGAFSLGGGSVPSATAL